MAAAFVAGRTRTRAVVTARRRRRQTARATGSSAAPALAAWRAVAPRRRCSRSRGVERPFRSRRRRHRCADHGRAVGTGRLGVDCGAIPGAPAGRAASAGLRASRSHGDAISTCRRHGAHAYSVCVALRVRDGPPKRLREALHRHPRYRRASPEAGRRLHERQFVPALRCCRLGGRWQGDR